MTKLERKAAMIVAAATAGVIVSGIKLIMKHTRYLTEKAAATFGTDDGDMPEGWEESLTDEVPEEAEENLADEAPEEAVESLAEEAPKVPEEEQQETSDSVDDKKSE